MTKTSPSEPPSSLPIPDEIAAFLDSWETKAQAAGDWINVPSDAHRQLRKLLDEEPSGGAWLCRPSQLLNYIEAIRARLIGPVAAAVMRKMCEDL